MIRHPGALLVLVLPLLFAAAAGAEEPTSHAEAILKNAGVRGGLIVHIGCGDGALTLALHAGDGYVVQGLDADADNVAATRARIRAAGMYGPVTARRHTGGRLPYADNLVNLLVISGATAADEDEMTRVLAPGGVLVDARRSLTAIRRLPVPEELDEWPHYLHGPDGNAVSQDRVIAPLERLQWLDGPRYGRHHDYMSSASAMVSGGGRVFAIFDHGSPQSIQLPSRWQLVARDAFNGVVLWRRPIESWHTQLWRLKSGPAHLPRRLVVQGDTVYVTLGLNAPVSALDAATGRTVRTFPRTEGTEETLASEGMLFLTVNPGDAAAYPTGQVAPGSDLYSRETSPRHLVAVNASDGVVAWQLEPEAIVPGSLALSGERVVFYNGEEIVCVNRADGRKSWRSQKLGTRTPVPSYFTPTLVLHDDSVLFSGGEVDNTKYHVDNGKTLTCLDAATGKMRWQAEHAPSGYRSAEDVFVIDGTVWYGDMMKAVRTETMGRIWGRDLRTGEITAQFDPDVKAHWFHHRCYRARATERYLLTSRTGIEFVDFRARKWQIHHWVRGACLYGIMPANGMIYSPPHPCACYLEAKMYGFNALAPASPEHAEIVEEQAAGRNVERGEAEVFEPVADPEAWPTYRADAARSGCVMTSVEADALRPSWQADLGGRLTPPVASGGTTYVARIDAHRLHALDMETGRSRWTYDASGRIDSPPTVWRGRVYFGSRDGRVTCLRASDGALVWRFRAAPADLQRMMNGQLESIWPVHGAVLVRETGDDTAEVWCTAGFSMFTDGGIRLLRLDARDGALLAETVMGDTQPGSDEELQMKHSALSGPTALSDVLSCDGRHVFMRTQPFDLEGRRADLRVGMPNVNSQTADSPHLFSPTGFLDDSWWHRSYWVYGRGWRSGAGGYYRAGRWYPAGRPLVFDDANVYGYGRKAAQYKWMNTLDYEVFCAAKQPEILHPEGQRHPTWGFDAMKPVGVSFKRTWALDDVPVLVRAMVLTEAPDGGKTIYLAGADAVLDEKDTLASFATKESQALLAQQEAALSGARGGHIRALSAQSGMTLAELHIDTVPVFDGLIAADGCLLMSGVNGRVSCFSTKKD